MDDDDDDDDDDDGDDGDDLPDASSTHRAENTGGFVRQARRCEMSLSCMYNQGSSSTVRIVAP